MAKGKKGGRNFRNVYGKTMVTPVGRLVFPRVARPEPFTDGAEEKFSASVVCKPSDRLNELLSEIQRIKALSFGDAEVSMPTMTGEEVLELSEKASEALYAGKYRVSAKSAGDKEPPKCYLADRALMPRRPGNENDVQDIDRQFYAGAWVRLCVTPFTYHVGASKGVSLILRGIQFIKDGDKLGQADIDAEFAANEAEEGYEWEDEVGDTFCDDYESGEVADEPINA